MELRGSFPVIRCCVHRGINLCVSRCESTTGWEALRKTSDKTCQSVPGLFLKRPSFQRPSYARSLTARPPPRLSASIEQASCSWSRGAQHIFGWTEDEMLGQKLDRLFTKKDQKVGLLAREMTDALAHGRGGGEEGWRIRKDGSRICAAGENVAGPQRGWRRHWFHESGAGPYSAAACGGCRRAGTALASFLNRAGSALAIETDLTRLVQIVTDAGVELTGAEFGAFFYI
jgi:PAS domain S-box-containing protein